MGRFKVAVRLGRRIDEAERLAPIFSRSVSMDDDLVHPIGRKAISLATLLSGEESAIASEPLLFGGVGEDPPPSNFPFAIGDPLTEVSDRRFFQPDFDVQPLRTVRGSRVRLKAAKPRRGTVSVPSGVSVRPVKDQVILCVRRKARRGVLIALGQGGGYHRKPRRTPNSDIWC